MPPPEGFTWDPNKNRLNREKHKVDFSDVVKVFKNRMLYMDHLLDDVGEYRERVLGFADPHVYIVVFTRRGSNIRLISARKAGQRDTELYYSEFFGDTQG